MGKKTAISIQLIDYASFAEQKILLLLIRPPGRSSHYLRSQCFKLDTVFFPPTTIRTNLINETSKLFRKFTGEIPSCGHKTNELFPDDFDSKGAKSNNVSKCLIIA